MPAPTPIYLLLSADESGALAVAPVLVAVEVAAEADAESSTVEALVSVAHEEELDLEVTAEHNVGACAADFDDVAEPSATK